VKQSGGYIWVHSEPGRGTAFNICFPGATEKAHPVSTTAASHRSLRGTETALLVEDQPLLRRLVGVMLRSTGYKVLAVESPAKELEAAPVHPGPIELLISDVILPGMTGRALAEQLLKIRPETKYCSFPDNGKRAHPGWSIGLRDQFSAKTIHR
jgi:PleD family two-component response regulator